MMNSTSKVRRILEKDGKTLVSFDAHDAYFTAPPAVADMLRHAEALGLTVHFSYDINMVIHGVVGHGD